MTDTQEKAIEEALQAARACEQRAEKCGRLGLTVLAREYDYFAKSIQERVSWQRRAIDGPSITSQADGTAVIERQP